MKILILPLLFLVLSIQAQELKFPKSISQGHPRLMTDNSGKDKLQKMLASQPEALKIYNKEKESIDKYVSQHQTDSTWIVSRLQMYWKSHATNVYVKGGIFSHTDGHAPAPTVRFTGTRDAVASYAYPKLEEIMPYMDDEKGNLYLINRNNNNAMEWVHAAKAGRSVESINRSILKMAKKAAFIYWYSGDTKYAKFATDLFDTYMTGIYYRNEPIDLNHSHIQTLVGLTSFEVIHEDILDEVTVCYDFLYDYLAKNKKEKMSIYADTFKKWADLIIKNGVPFNNWDLIEAKFVNSIALILEDDKQYKDKKGCQYYLNQILNQSCTRQWSIPQLINFGLDSKTGIWNECAGYSQNVIGDFADFVTVFDNTLKIDLLNQVPIIEKASKMMAQYMFPNGNVVGFGDTHYGFLSTRSMQQMVINANHFNKPQQEILFTKLLKLIQSYSGEKIGEGLVGGFESLFSKTELTLNDTIKAGRYQDFTSPIFYAPKTSWLAQRNGFDSQNGLMISQAASLGNHMHSNGIAMELYGKGLVLAPEGGIGTSYFQPDYAEYYSQFPAHNTVCVDGISKYPEMRSAHAFEVLSTYPKSEQQNGYFPLVTYSDIYFHEPETDADQKRLMSIVRTSDSTGYYVDIFRSKRRNNKDKYHDYFYHNLGQELTFTDLTNKVLDLKPTEKLAFASGDLFAYDYLWNKKSMLSTQTIKANYKLSQPNKDDIFMNLWLKADENREFFSVKSPASKAWGHTMISKEIAELPLNTIVIRQSGQAYTRPFGAIIEPSTSKQKSAIVSTNYFGDSTFVGIKVITTTNSQTIFSSESESKLIQYEKSSFQGIYGVISENEYLFLGKGKMISNDLYRLEAKNQNTQAAFYFANQNLYISTTESITLTIPDTYQKGKVVLTYNKVRIEGKRINNTISFEIPALNYTKIEIGN